MPEITVNPEALDPSQCHVAIIEDDPLLRRLLRRHIEEWFHPKGILDYADGFSGLDGCMRTKPELLLIDMRLPDIGGLDIITRLRAERLPIRILALTGYVESTLPAELINLGVAGFVDKGSPLENVKQALERVLSGGMYFASRISPAVLGSTRGSAEAGRGQALLSVREREVVKLVTKGMSSKEIGVCLNLSTRTVEKYRANAMDKLQVRDTANLIRWCLNNGLG